MIDDFAQIALTHHPVHRDKLRVPQPAHASARVLPLNGAPGASAFESARKACGDEDLKVLLDACRSKYRPFLEDHAPPIESYRTVDVILQARWRLETEADRHDFADTLAGGGDWQLVDLPHYRGPVGRHTAYYHTTFTLNDEHLRGRAVFVRFKGVDYRTSVFVNGYLLGSHEGFFSPFEFDLTAHGRTGENVLLVRVENDDKGEAGEKLYAATGLGWDEPGLGWHHCPPGMGIYQPVTIESRPRVHIHDLFVRPLVEQHVAEVWIEVRNCDLQPADVRFDLTIHGQNFSAERVAHVRYRPETEPEDGLGDTYAEVKRRIHGVGERRLPMRRGINYLRVPMDLGASTRLWSPDEPNLYQLQCRLVDEAGVVFDAAKRQFGMRSFTQDTVEEPRGALRLNGELVRLRGANTMGHEQQCVFHDDMDQLVEDILLSKVCHLNFWRLTQRPVQEEVYDYCDRLGLMTQTDLPLFGRLQIGQFSEAARQAGEMERLVRGHPCNVMVSYINEPFPNADNHPQRFLSRTQLRMFFEAADLQVRLYNPDRVIKPVDGDYDPPSPGMPDHHCYAGWYNGHGVDLGMLHRGYWQPVKPGWYYGCGEFGSEGLDPVGLMKRRYPQAWLPQDGDESTWSPSRIPQAQSGHFHHFYYDTPRTLADWVSSSQRHQARITKLMAEAFRRDERMVSFAIHLLIDAFPAGWMKAIVDCERRPKPAFYRYRDALSPVMVCLRSDRTAWWSGETAELEAWVCNDRARPINEVELCYQLELDGRVVASGCSPIRVEASSARCFGKVSFALPHVAQRELATARIALTASDGAVLHDNALEMCIHAVAEAPVMPRVCVIGPRNEVVESLFEAFALNQTDGRATSDDVLLVTDVLAFLRDADRWLSLVRLGATMIINEPPDGMHKLKAMCLRVTPIAVGPVHFVSRQTGHPLVDGFSEDDLRFWFDERAGYVTPLLTSTHRVEDVEPILTSADIDTTGRWSTVYGASLRRFGLGAIIVNQVSLAHRLETNPAARAYAARLLSYRANTGGALATKRQPRSYTVIDEA